ncbi:MAG: transposase [Eubacterium sp.]|nr:transposase [Eubacterium sp.]
MQKCRDSSSVPIWEKYLLTVDEASVYYHIGRKKLRSMIAADPSAPYIITNGSHVLIKRERFSAYLDEVSAI